MKRRTLVIAILLVLIGLIILVILMRPNADTLSPSELNATVSKTNPVDEQNATTILYTSDGFMPRSLTVPKGAEVVFINLTAQSIWPQADEGGRDCTSKKRLDSCEAIKPGGSYHFSATESGIVSYHDTLRPGRAGTVVIE